MYVVREHILRPATHCCCFELSPVCLVCVCERERVGEWVSSVCVCERERGWVSGCHVSCVCERERVGEWVSSVCVCVRERGWVSGCHVCVREGG